MSARRSNSPDTAALLTVLRQAMEMCRRLDLPEDAATFKRFIARFQKEPPTYEVLREEGRASLNGVPALRILSKLGNDYSEFNRLRTALSRVIFPENHEPKKQRRRRKRKAVRDSNACWNLEGESELQPITIPDPPKASASTTVRLTLSNPSGPLDEVEVFVRVGDPDDPTTPDDLDTAKDWAQADLVEELVFFGGEEMLRSAAQEPFKGEIPWEGTYETKLSIPAGRCSIEVKVVSRHPEWVGSRVLTGWEVEVK